MIPDRGGRLTPFASFKRRENLVNQQVKQRLAQIRFAKSGSMN